ncbi:DUF885 domain-containing protein [Paeniglutamicibacter terrestris]|uniref:DUF885 domain-containing protein n=1 Tax=Paeniglutamicibacter terrestris TaxID=2723403 RepID=A0ABX1G5F2_9MICC|nr:DUF885 domain-containing protein [Paeniglutamicibacter terrestris]ASN40171.1 DUF885 domain-containing protein [Arthrobacter sp. 7749]NKG21498.1 DUF885 domain-containing protein [Paeniglutamicibacter terrestris]
MTDITSPRTPSAIDTVANEYFARLLELIPEFATELGLPGREAEYSDYSPAGIEAQTQAAREALAALAPLQPVDAVDEITLDAMKERLGLDLEIAATQRTELNNIASTAQSLRAIFDLMPQETATDYGFIAERMHNLPAAMAGYIAALRDSAAKGQYSAARQVKIVITQARDYAKSGGFFETLSTSGAAVAPELAERLTSGAEACNAAYRLLASVLEDELLPASPTKDAVGREYYALMSRRFLGAAVDLEETYAWGVEELDSIIKEQQRVADQISSGASIEEAKLILNQDPARQLAGTDALQRWMQQKSDEALAALAGTHFDIPAPMDKIQCMIAPTQEGGIYYTGPSEDFSRPGRMWWSVPEGEEQFTTWAELTTVYHEGVPGHHLQVATAVMARDTLNDWRRSACWVSGHGEGWALYAERLMRDLGFLSDPGDYLGMLDAQRMRAARVVFDIGVHLELEIPAAWGSGTWDSESGFDFLSKNLDISAGQLEFEFTRYLGWPGQAPAYKVGQRLWEQIRDERAASAGADFDLKAFHTQALGVGSVGLDTLKRALLG